MAPERVEDAAGWFRRAVGPDRVAPEGLTWGHVPEMVAAARAGSDCECCGVDRPDPASLVRVVALLARLRAGRCPPPWCVYAHCGGEVIAEWCFDDYRPGHAGYVRASAYAWPDEPEAVQVMVSRGTPGRDWTSVWADMHL